jgi:hypothetical protein
LPGNGIGELAECHTRRDTVEREIVALRGQYETKLSKIQPSMVIEELADCQTERDVKQAQVQKLQADHNTSLGSSKIKFIRRVS